MELQEAFDFVVDKLAEQKVRCMGSDLSGCSYGNEKDHHCAVGWLLDYDNEKMMSFRGDLKSLMVDVGRHKVPVVIQDNIEAFTILQDFHDDSRRIEREATKTKLAYYFDVSNPNVDIWVNLGKSKI